MFHSEALFLHMKKTGNGNKKIDTCTHHAKLFFRTNVFSNSLKI